MKTSLIASLLILGLVGCAKRDEPIPAAGASMSAMAETAAKPEETGTDTTEAAPQHDSAAEAPASTAASAAPTGVEAPKPPVPAKSAPAVEQSSAAEPSKAPALPIAPTPAATSAAPTPVAVEPPAPSRTDTPSVAAGADATEGRAIVKAKCAPCHGADGSGKTAMGKKYEIGDWRSDEVRALSDADFVRILHEGAGKVSATAHKSKALSADDIRTVVAFIRSLK